MNYLSFSWIDYVLFALLFGISSGIGGYYGFCAKQKQSTNEYLLGGRKMKVFPISMSLIASTLSGITLLSAPAEIYIYGSQFMLVMVVPLIMYFVLNYIYLPIFWKLELKSVFEYLEIRFDRNLRTLASFLFTVNTLFYLPIVIYVPSLAFNQVTGFNLYIIALIMSLICVFYTAVGGFKAVVWTDTLQFCFTLCTLSYVFILGIISVGGIPEIWEKAKKGQRLEFFNMNPDPTVRNTFWTVMVGMTLIWVSFAVTNPGVTQRFLSVPTLRDSKRVLITFVCFKMVTQGICCFSGLIMFAKYSTCDPLSTRQIKKADQILPFYVMDVAKHLPGFGGLFVAGLFSTSLSSLSTSLNALSGTIYLDFVSRFMPSNASDRTASNIMKILTLMLGLVCVGMVFVINKLGTVVELGSSLSGSTLGPLLGIFTLGTMLPTANTKGALVGVISSLLVMSIVTVMYQMHVWRGDIKYPPKPLYTHGCNDSLLQFSSPNNSYINKFNATPETLHWLFKISVHYYIAMGMVLTVITGLFTSCFFKADKPINPDTICPCVERLFLRSLTTTRTSDKELNEFCSNGTNENDPLRKFAK